MRKFALAAILALTSSAACAGSVFEIPINGGVACIQLNDNCRENLCASVSWSERGSRGERREFELPGISSKTLSKMLDTHAPGWGSIAPDDEDDTDTREVERQSPPPAVGSKRKPAPSASAPTSSPPGEPRLSDRPSPAPSPMPTAPADPSVPAIEPQAGPAPSATIAPAPAAPADAKVAAFAPAPASAPDAKASRRSPIGEWLVEDGEGQIRIEECGANLCGYVSAAKNPGDKDRKNPDPALRNRSVIGMPVLIDMKPSGNRWNGRIYNVKNGETYTANISLKGGDTLRVEGCAFGGLVCGGQNWSRVN